MISEYLVSVAVLPLLRVLRALVSKTANCGNLVEIDLSNATELRDLAAAAVAEAKNLERLWLVRCKSITDIGIGCIAVGCRKLRLLSLKWCLGVGDLGVGLVAVKCRDLRSLDLSYLPITNKCVSQILELQHLEDLVLEGCFGIDDDRLTAPKLGCTSAACTVLHRGKRIEILHL